ncbi:Retrovirus-related Pol polyprotein from transposon RE1 [Vitis vinifera]|nr:Retrovirus-related Pol polyprotein from transposon RE1 [Vitis vinifera]
MESLLDELGLTLREPPLLLCDNVGVTQLNLNPVMHSKMKHIAINFHFVHDFVHCDKLCVAHVHMDDQLADKLTKPLAWSRFNLLRGKINIADGTSILRGRIREST